ncbi:hypothetical protein [Kutzneria kofuensis]|uniref:Uncharacterized protein n=1 Tax=Kutzneria kofuensis TaxID=103725 RepID=A0A7W9NLU9_9PSEU|nr:hypothetical protein [Kutzneria kofuensis]MBB5897440.1 hypothetical protein [Kutzneria kofuensis]
MAHVNKGIQMFGGTINADNIAVGDNAHAESTESEPGTTRNTVNGDPHTVIQAGRIDSITYADPDDE